MHDIVQRSVYANELDQQETTDEDFDAFDCSSSSSDPCQHDYDGSYWIKYGLGWCIEQCCSKCGHREHSHFVGVK